MEISAKSVFTIIFLLLISLAATYIPIRAFDLQSPAFYEVLSKKFNFTPDMGVFRSYGMGVTNVKGRSLITLTPPAQEEAIYDLKLSFDNNDLLGSYSFVSANYETNFLQKVSGNASAKFILSKGSIFLIPSENAVFGGNSLSIQSFTIDFWLYPYRLGEGLQTIMEFKGQNYEDPLDVRQYGITVFIDGDILTYSFSHFFRDKQTNTFSFRVKEKKSLNQEQWERHTLVLDSSANMLRVYRGGEEQEVIPITADGSIFGEKVFPSDHIAASKVNFPLILGENALFSLDDFAIIREIQTNFTDTDQKVRFLETDVYRISSNTSWLYRMNVMGQFPPQAGWRLAYRFSPLYFLPESSNIPWVYIDPQKNIFPPSKSLGQYLQWRFEYTAQETGPPMELYGIELNYRENPTPASLKVNLTAEGDGSATLEWMSLSDNNIVSYEIYYGKKSGVYFAADSPVVLKADTNSLSMPMSYTVEGLENETAYYMVVRARDRFGKLGDSSEEIYVRPSLLKAEPYYSIGR